MGDKSREKIDKHHNQVQGAKSRRAKRYQAQLVWESKRIGISAKFKADREALIAAVLVFMIGLGLIFFLLIYLFGVILYG